MRWKLWQKYNYKSKKYPNGYYFYNIVNNFGEMLIEELGEKKFNRYRGQYTIAKIGDKWICNVNGDDLQVEKIRTKQKNHTSSIITRSSRRNRNIDRTFDNEDSCFDFCQTMILDDIIDLQKQIQKYNDLLMNKIGDYLSTSEPVIWLTGELENKSYIKKYFQN